ncbi:hypothetical protein KX928_18005 [Roseobacter sp. YSTF-M11]|uniref:PH domain-containing protein n=1 Tax=Roseobacter insulae TaxID=2859783 RepID=A0A9X1FX33_9RHOB|nr:STM3941 family protein [Roseobacter insulae]MBW4709685.1 hypothetical protein [Roseobacter insulae]
MTNTSKTIEIRKSRAAYLGLALICVVLIGLAHSVANGGMLDDPRGGAWTIPYGWFGVVFFGSCLLTVLNDLLFRPATILSLSPSGLRDLRFSRDELPWASVTGVREYKLLGSRCVIINIDPADLTGMKLSWRFRFWHKPNALIGVDGVWVTAVGLKTNFNDLFYDILAYARALSPHMQIPGAESEYPPSSSAPKADLPDREIS